MSKILDVQIEVPDSAPEAAMRFAEALARESVIVGLQQQGELTITRAAADLGITYDEYLQLLTRSGLPACHDEVDPAALEVLRAGIRRRAAAPP